MGVDVLSFGCRLNALDGESVRALARAGGAVDMVVINACAVTAEAGRQGRQAVRRAARERPHAEIVVTGCGAQVEPSVYSVMPEVSRVVGLAARTRRGTWVSTEARQRIDVGDVFMVDDVSAPPADADILRPRASVQAQTGCDHRCTFCVIPFGRGASRSTPVDAVVAEVRRVVGLGAVEAVLTGVDLTAWGADLAGAPALGRLVRAILRDVPELKRLRLSSLDAVEVDDELLGVLGDEERLMPHLHLSLQSGDDMILKRMKRRHSAADAIRFCERSRRLRPDVAFGADVIAGFPTETNEMFENTLATLEACGVAYVHAFPFSARPETPAARMPQTPAAVVKARAARLRETGQKLLARHLDAHVGRSALALSEGAGVGRLPDFTLVALPAATPKGVLVAVTPTGHDGRRLIADLSA
jgi:threonylcarbamoyladenosine tRNA methylthiotransferase MtaB